MRFLINNLFLLLLLGIIVLGYFIGFTESGLRFSASYISQHMPGKLTIEKVNGKLFSKFILENISYDNGQKQITIKSIDFTWNPAGLLHDKLVIENLVLENPIIKIISTQSSSNPYNFNWLKYIILKKFTIKHLSIQSKDAKVEFNGMLTDSWHATWRISIPHLDVISPHYSGSLTSSGNIFGPLPTPVIHATLIGKNLLISHNKITDLNGKINIDLHHHAHSTLGLTAKGITVNKLKLNTLEIKLDGQVHHEQEAIVANLNMTLAKNYYFTALLSLPKFTTLSDLNQPIKGSVKVSTTSLDFLTQYIPYIKNPLGTVQGIFAVNGTLGQPKITGKLNLAQGRVAIPCLGISLNKINVNILNNNSLVNYQGSFSSGRGQATLQGAIDLNLDNPPLLLSVKGKNLQIIHLPEYTILASPDVALSFANNVMQIIGNIVVDDSEIALKNFGNTVTLPDEIIFIDEKNPQISLPFDTTMQINLILGDHIHFAYKDLTTDLSGKLKLLQTLNGPITATGELRAIKGTYNAYGHVLQIQDGRLIFTGGSLINPGLNIRAVKQISTILMEGKSNFVSSALEKQPIPVYSGTELVTLGVQLIGTLDNLKVSLFSIPGGMTQNDILSYLTLGHSITQSSKQANGTLLNAASAINMGSKTKLNNVTQKLQNKLGLTELDVAPTESFDPITGKVLSTTSLVIGKELVPDLYAHYSKSLFDPVQTLNLRYKLSKRFAIQSETSTISNGADLLYSIERD